MILGDRYKIAVCLAQSQPAHFRQRCCSGTEKKLHFRIIGADAIRYGVCQAIDDHDLMGWRSLLGAQRIEGFENSCAILGARAADQDRESG
jgi:hypothetical protein